MCVNGARWTFSYCQRAIIISVFLCLFSVCLYNILKNKPHQIIIITWHSYTFLCAYTVLPFCACTTKWWASPWHCNTMEWWKTFWEKGYYSYDGYSEHKKIMWKQRNCFMTVLCIVEFIYKVIHYFEKLCNENFLIVCGCVKFLMFLFS